MHIYSRASEQIFVQIHFFVQWINLRKHCFTLDVRFSINVIEIDRVNEVLFLGVILDEHLIIILIVNLKYST